MRHSGYLFGSKLLSRVIFTVFSLYAAVRLGPGLFGTLAFTLAMVELINSVGDVGLTRYGTRELVRHWNDRAVIGGEIMALQVGTSVVFGLAAAAVILAVGPGGGKTSVLLIGVVSVVAWGAVSATESLLVANESFLASALFSLLGKVLFAAAGAAAISAGLAVEYVLLAFLGAVLVEAAVRVAWTSASIARPSFSFSLKDLARMLRATAPFAVSALSSIAVLQAGTIILGILDDDEAVGIFSVAFSLFLPFMWAPVILARTMFPGLAGMYMKDRVAARMNSWQWYRLMAMAGIPVAALVSILAEPAMAYLPESYSHSADILAVLIWALPLTLLSAVELNILQITDREREGARINLMAAVVTIALDFILIPLIGPLGVALAILAGALLREAQIYFQVFRHFMKKHMYVLFLRPLAGGAVMLAVAFALRPHNPWAAAAAGAASYVVVMVVTGAVRPNEVRRLIRG